MRVASVMGALLGAEGGPAGKQRLARLFSGGALRLEREGASTLVISEEDANFEAKSILALTLIRASYQTTEILDEVQAAKALGERSLPSGFYALAPGASPRIAAAYLPELAGAKKSPAAAFIKRLESLKKAGKATPNCFATRFEAEPEAFARARDPLADFMSVGAGAEPQEKRRLREEARESALDRFGLRVRTRLPDGGWETGYPAPLSLRAKAIGQAYESGSLQERRMIRQDMSLVSSLSEAGRLPLFNHDAASAINNTRDIQTAMSRAPERVAMVDSMVDAWMAREAILSGGRDAELRLGGLDENEARQLREIAAGAELKPFGKERKLFVGQSKTASHASEDGREHLLLSMDMALVDGQHSSRDYALIAAGCLAASGGRAPMAPDCAPAALKERVWARYARNHERGGLDPLGVMPAAPDPLDPPARRGRARRAAERSAKDKLWAAFARFAPDIPLKIEIAATGDPEMSLLYSMMENSVKEQSPEAKAMAANRREAQAFVAAFNEAAESSGDPTRIAAVKSQHMNPEVSTADRPEEITRDFIDIFPYLRAVINAEKTTASARLKNEEVRAARELARWETLAILESKGAKVASVKDPRFEALSDRLLVLILTANRLRGRDMEISSEKLAKTLAIAAQPETAGSRLGAFTAMALNSARRFLSSLGARVEKKASDANGPGSSPQPLTDQERVYALGKLALELKDALRPERRAAGNPLSEIMSDSALDNVMLSMLMTRHALHLTAASHPSAPEAADDFRSARRRLQTHVEDSQPAVFSEAQESFKRKLQELAESGRLKPFPASEMISESTRERSISESVLLSLSDERQRDLLIDAIPGSGDACSEMGAVVERGASPRAA